MNDQQVGEAKGEFSEISRREESLGTVIAIAIALILLAWLAFNWFQTIQLVVHRYSSIPFADYWRVGTYVARYQALDIRVLWRQHNEHRIVFPEIVFATDVVAFRGRQIFTLAVSFVCYLCTWLMLAWTLFSDGSFPRNARVAAALLAGVVIGWKGSASVVAEPFLLQWTLVQLAGLGSFVFLGRVKFGRANLHLALTIIAAVIATYSSGNALTLWPVLMCAGLILHLRRSQMTALGIAGVVFIGLYFVGYQFLGDLKLANMARHPFYLTGFLASYLSMPFGGMKGPSFGLTVGLTNLCVAAVLFVIAARGRWLPSRATIVLFGWYAFTVATALMTAAGRMDATDPGFGAAKPARYVTMPLLNWAALVSLCLLATGRYRAKAVFAEAILFVLAVLLAIGFVKLRWWLEGSEQLAVQSQLAELGFNDGLVDPGLIRKIFPDPSLVYACLPKFREDHLSVYYRSRSKWLGAPIERFARVASTQATGEMTYTFPVRSGVEVVGWADVVSRGAEYDWVLLANERGQIAGFGRRLPAGFPKELRSSRVPSALGWVGFVNLAAAPTKTIRAYVINRSGLLPIRGALDTPEEEPASLQELGGPVGGIEWHRDSVWTLDGYAPHSRYDPPPPGVVYASWSGRDENTGEMISSTFPAPANGCMILPVLHGPSADGQSVEVQDGDTGKLLETMPMQNEDWQWEFWRMRFDSTVKNLRIIARDEGHDWGQWLAVGQPNTCR